MKIHARWGFKLTILSFDLKQESHVVQLNISLYQRLSQILTIEMKGILGLRLGNIQSDIHVIRNVIRRY